MKIIILISFLGFFLMACENRCRSRSKLDSRSIELNSTSMDIRCVKLHYEADKKGKETGVCGINDKVADPNPKACDDLYKEVEKQCKALPPDPKYMKKTSDSTFVRKGKVIVDGKPVSKKRLPWCDECPTCKPIDSK